LFLEGQKKKRGGKSRIIVVNSIYYHYSFGSVSRKEKGGTEKRRDSPREPRVSSSKAISKEGGRDSRRRKENKPAILFSLKGMVEGRKEKKERQSLHTFLLLILERKGKGGEKKKGSSKEKMPFDRPYLFRPDKKRGKRVRGKNRGKEKKKQIVQPFYLQSHFLSARTKGKERKA